jgi:hypothetical protein
MSNTRKAKPIGNGRDTALVSSDFLKGRREPRIVECPGSGNRYRLRSLTNAEFNGLIGAFVDVGRLAATDGELAEQADRLAMEAATNAARKLEQFEALVTAALVEPAIGDGPDQISVKDIPYGDLAHLAGDVSADCGLTRARAATLRPTSAAGS